MAFDGYEYMQLKTKSRITLPSIVILRNTRGNATGRGKCAIVIRRRCIFFGTEVALYFFVAARVLTIFNGSIELKNREKTEQDIMLNAMYLYM